MDAATPEIGTHPFQYFHLVPVDAGTATARKAAMDQGRRQQLAERALNSANDTAKAIGTVRAFDRTGNITDSLAHLIASAEATLANARALAKDIRDASAGTHPLAKAPEVSVNVIAGVSPEIVARAAFDRQLNRQR